MPFFKSNIVLEDAKYIIWKITENLQELSKGITLSADDQHKLSSINHIEKQKEFYAIRQCLKIAFQQNTAVHYQDSGKPTLDIPDIHVSFSHCDGFAGILFSKIKKVGFDLEVARNTIERIAPRFINEPEKQSLSKTNRLEHLLFYWGAKEAIVKIEDDKKIDFKEEINITPFPYFENTQTSGHLSRSNKKQQYIFKFETLGNVQVTCASHI